MFHAFTRCDTVSQFNTVGKITAWKVWESFEPIPTVFAELAREPQLPTTEQMETMARFVVLLYDISSNATRVNNADCTWLHNK